MAIRWWQSGSSNRAATPGPCRHVTVMWSSLNNSCLWFHGKLGTRFPSRWLLLTTLLIKMRCLHISGACSPCKNALPSSQLSFFVLAMVNHNIDLLSYCSLASFHLFSLLFQMISWSHRVPLGCMNNTCCHACVFLCAWSYPPVCLGAALKWLVSRFLWWLPAFWAWEYLHRTYNTLLSIPQPYPLAISAPSHKNDAIELN